MSTFRSDGPFCPGCGANQEFGAIHAAGCTVGAPVPAAPQPDRLPDCRFCGERPFRSRDRDTGERIACCLTATCPAQLRTMMADAQWCRLNGAAPQPETGEERHAARISVAEEFLDADERDHLTAWVAEHRHQRTLKKAIRIALRSRPVVEAPALSEEERRELETFENDLGERDVRWVHLVRAGLLKRCVAIALSASPSAERVEQALRSWNRRAGSASPRDSEPTPRAHMMATIADELDHAYAKHGRVPWGRHEFYAILLEEVEELWDEIKADAPQDAVLKELRQVAAMCFRYYETGDAYRGAHPEMPMRRTALASDGAREGETTDHGSEASANDEHGSRSPSAPHAAPPSDREGTRRE